MISIAKPTFLVIIIASISRIPPSFAFIIQPKTIPTLPSNNHLVLDRMRSLPHKHRNTHRNAIPAVISTFDAVPTISVICHILGGVSGTPIVFRATKSDGWYRKIALPPWTPPDRLFGPVWTTLYACMGVAVARVVQRPVNPYQSMALVTWAFHYALNLLWAPVFFGMKRLRLGFLINVALASSLAILIIPLFYRSNPLSALLLLPYLAWLLFATYLNLDICRRNPTRNGYNEAMLQADIIRLQKEAAKYANSE